MLELRLNGFDRKSALLFIPEHVGGGEYGDANEETGGCIMRFQQIRVSTLLALLGLFCLGCGEDESQVASYCTVTVNTCGPLDDKWEPVLAEEAISSCQEFVDEFSSLAEENPSCEDEILAFPRCMEEAWYAHPTIEEKCAADPYKPAQCEAVMTAMQDCLDPE